MDDQAVKLRERMLKYSRGERAQTVAVVSGKGGVGKSNLSLNLSIALAHEGKRVLVFDMDVGMGNIDLLSGIPASRSIADFFNGNCSLEEIISEGPAGIRYISGGTGLKEFFNWGMGPLNRLQQAINRLLYEFDFFFFDFGAGMREETARFLGAMDRILVVVTPEPTALTDAYSAIKYIFLTEPEASLYLVGNRLQDGGNDRETVERLSRVIARFLNRECPVVGYIPEDISVLQAVKKQNPVLLHSPRSPAARAIREMAESFLLGIPPKKNRTESIAEKIKWLFLERW